MTRAAKKMPQETVPRKGRAAKKTPRTPVQGAVRRRAKEALHLRAKAFRWGQLISGLESAQASLKLALRASDLLNDHDKKLLHEALEALGSVEQRSWVLYNKRR